MGTEIYVLVVTQLYSLVKAYQTIYLKRVTFNLCKLILNKPELNKIEQSKVRFEWGRLGRKAT